MKSVVVITPTTGTDFLSDAIESVSSQTYQNVRHLIIGDGLNLSSDVAKKLPDKWWDNPKIQIQVTFIPDNTGANGFYGHRVYAGYPHFLNCDYICFLDEDNWFKPDHVESLVTLIENKNLDWAYSLRDLYQPNKDFFDSDCCESIGKWPVFFTQEKEEKIYLIDTSAYCFKTSWLIKYSHYWHWGWGGDRRFFSMVRECSNFDTTGQHTLCYRLDDKFEQKYGSPLFFSHGNKTVEQFYGGFPWKQNIQV